MAVLWEDDGRSVRGGKACDAFTLIGRDVGNSGLMRRKPQVRRQDEEGL